MDMQTYEDIEELVFSATSWVATGEPHLLDIMSADVAFVYGSYAASGGGS